jgi:hypothetical protein
VEKDRVAVLVNIFGTKCEGVTKSKFINVVPPVIPARFNRAENPAALLGH